jgi:choice-of-anchor B domain-containing protein
MRGFGHGFLAAFALLAWGCGGGGSSSPAEPEPPASLNMTLAAHLDLGTLSTAAQVQHDEPLVVTGAVSGAGNWGYSAGGRRFALTGTSAGLSIVEVTNPQSPRPIALVAGAASAWREVKTYRQYAYVTTEAKTGLDIIDLSDVDHPRKVRTWNRTFKSAHTLWVDSNRGLLFVNGTGLDDDNQNGMRVLSLRPDPTNPREVGSFNEYYVHDSFTRGNVLYASAIYDGFEAMLDVSDPARIRETGRFITGGRFTHNSALTRDGRYLFTTDERIGRPLEGWNVADPVSPTKVTEFIARAGTIPHNVMIDRDRLLVAHYTEGVYLLNIQDPEHPQVMGYYDTLQTPATGFQGAWGAYIFPGTNTIVVSDINGGLFVLIYTGA